MSTTYTINLDSNNYASYIVKEGWSVTEHNVRVAQCIYLLIAP